MAEFDYAGRQARLQERLAALEVDVAFVSPSGDLEYLTGFPRRKASFGNYEHANQWLLGGLFSPGREPKFLVNQGYAAFQLPDGVEGDVVVAANADDGDALVRRELGTYGSIKRIGLSARTWAATAVRLADATGAALVNIDDEINRLRRIKAPDELEVLRECCLICDKVMAEVTPLVRVGALETEIAAQVDVLGKRHGGTTPSFDTGVFALGPGFTRDATTRTSETPLIDGLGVSFDFGTVYRGYCSDFGRAIHIGEPSALYREAYDVVIAAQAAGAAAAVPGATGSEVDAATRGVIEEAGFGEWFRHRTGHCIGMDTHERPFMSDEDHTPLEENMTFTIEPSIFWPEHVGARVEDIFVCRPGGAQSLNEYPRDLVSV